MFACIRTVRSSLAVGAAIAIAMVVATAVDSSPFVYATADRADHFQGSHSTSSNLEQAYEVPEERESIERVVLAFVLDCPGASEEFSALLEEHNVAGNEQKMLFEYYLDVRRDVQSGHRRGKLQIHATCENLGK